MPCEQVRSRTRGGPAEFPFGLPVSQADCAGFALSRLARQRSLRVLGSCRPVAHLLGMVEARSGLSVGLHRPPPPSVRLGARPVSGSGFRCSGRAADMERRPPYRRPLLRGPGWRAGGRSCGPWSFARDWLCERAVAALLPERRVSNVAPRRGSGRYIRRASPTSLPSVRNRLARPAPGNARKAAAVRPIGTHSVRTGQCAPSRPADPSVARLRRPPGRRSPTRPCPRAARSVDGGSRLAHRPFASEIARTATDQVSPGNGIRRLLGAVGVINEEWSRRRYWQTDV